MIRYFFLLILLFFFLGCQIAPTKILEVDQTQVARAFKDVQFGEPWDFKKAVIVDTRSRFEFEMSKTPRSFHVFWKDWSLQGYKGAQLELRQIELQRRLARKGIDSHSRVIVFGKGRQGQGEEMLVAATLFRLGIHKLAIITAEKLKKSLVTKGTQSINNLPYWQKPLTNAWECEDLKGKPYVIDSNSFDENLKLKPTFTVEKKLIALESKNGFWAYGAALQLLKQGKQVCVVLKKN